MWSKPETTNTEMGFLPTSVRDTSQGLLKTQSYSSISRKKLIDHEEKLLGSILLEPAHRVKAQVKAITSNCTLSLVIKPCDALDDWLNVPGQLDLLKPH